MSKKVLSPDHKRGRHNLPKALDLAMPPEELSAPSHSTLARAKPFFLDEALPVFSLQNLDWDTISPCAARSWSCYVEIFRTSQVLDGPQGYGAAAAGNPARWRWGWSLMCTTGPKWYEAA